MHAPWHELPSDFREAVLHGAKGFRGVIPFLVSREPKRYKQYIRVFLRQYQSPTTCRECAGARVRREALWVRVAGKTIAEAADMPLEQLRTWLDSLGLSPMEERIAETLLRELRARVGFLVDVGLGYLSLSRQTRSLSGGEAQRISLANSLGSALVDTLYVLDEPTVGLHMADVEKLIRVLHRLVDAGNTVVVIEHNLDVIAEADWVIDLGPEGGDGGGRVVAQCPPQELARRDTHTGRALREFLRSR